MTCIPDIRLVGFGAVSALTRGSDIGVLPETDHDFWRPMP